MHYLMMITVIGIFENINLAEEAASYLQANDFKSENVDVHTGPGEAGDVAGFFSHLMEDEKAAAHYASIAREGTVITVHALSTREAKEAVDVFNYNGAVEINAVQGLVVDRIVAEDKRLKGNGN